MYNNIPELKDELLGHHFENLQTVLRYLGEAWLGIHTSVKRFSNPGIEPPLIRRPCYVDKWLDQIMIDIDYKTMDELKRFP